MTFDILYSLPGDTHISRHLKTVLTEEYARHLCSTLTYFPAETIHYAITCDDGRVIHDSSRDGLII